jgi:hypothetical protein
MSHLLDSGKADWSSFTKKSPSDDWGIFEKLGLINRQLECVEQFYRKRILVLGMVAIFHAVFNN